MVYSITKGVVYNIIKAKSATLCKHSELTWTKWVDVCSVKPVECNCSQWERNRQWQSFPFLYTRNTRGVCVCLCEWVCVCMCVSQLSCEHKHSKLHTQCGVTEMKDGETAENNLVDLQITALPSNHRAA